ncbi:MAG: hypothetical protein ACTSQ3_04770 [Candidatus Heimdallarchaeota archaeon]
MAESEISVVSKSRIPEPVPGKRRTPPPERRDKKSRAKSEFPIPEPSQFPQKLVLSTLERKLEYGHNSFLFDGSKSTKFDKFQKSGVRKGTIDDIIPDIISKLEKIGWEISEIFQEKTFIVILMRLESAALGIAYTILDAKLAMSCLVVAKERFKKNTYDKIFDL